MKPIRAFFVKQGLRAAFRSGTYVAKAGAPADIVTGEANKQAFDLRVMSSHGHGSIANLLARLDGDQGGRALHDARASGALKATLSAQTWRAM